MAKLAKMSITRYALIGLAVLVVAGTAGLTTYFGFRKPHIQAVQPPAIQRVERKVEDKSPRIWCFRHKPAPEGILLYGLGIEDNGKLSKPFLLDAKKALDNSKPLAFACTEDGNIWWVSPDAIYSAKIAAKSGCCKLEQVRKLTHVEQPEYAVRGAAVVAASILMLDGQDLPYVATVDRTGWLKIFRPPLDGNQIKDFSLLYLGDKRLPDVGIIDKAVIGFLHKREIAIIMIGDKPIIVNIILKDGASYSDVENIGISASDLRKDPRIQAGRIIDAGLIVQTRIGHHESVLRIERLDGKIVEVPYIVTR